MKAYIILMACLMIELFAISTVKGQQWAEYTATTGEVQNCKNEITAKDKYIKNHLTIFMSDQSDVIVKVVEYYSDECIRTVFIKAGDYFSMKNIPKGKYYLKIAYGRQLLKQKTKTGIALKFKQNASYEKGRKLLEFNTLKMFYGTKIRSYEVHLDTKEKKGKNKQNMGAIAFNQ